MMDNKELWNTMLMESSAIVNHHVTEILYHRAAAAWAYDQTLTIPNGVGGTVNLTELFEQFRMLQILKGENDGKSESNS